MSIKEKYKVLSIPARETYDWLLNKHYAKRIPSISYAFGLYSGVDLVGVMTIGKPASPSLCDGVCGKENSKYVYELNRLCVIDGLERNALSYFLSSCINMIGLIESMIIVSYADRQWNHSGYIYQATNWIYTGSTKERTDIGQEDGTHSRHYSKQQDYSIRKHRSSKHRYVYFVGRLKKLFAKQLQYERLPYPKELVERYDSSYAPNTQTTLF